jgi:signal transduction histidine kinase
MNVLRVTALVIYSFGAFAYAALLMLWYQWASHGQRPDHGAPRTSRQTLFVSGSLWAVSFVWFALNLIVVLTQLAPSPPAPGLRSAIPLGVFWLAESFPPLITHMVWTEARDNHSPPPAGGWRLIVQLMYVLSGSLAVICTLGFLRLGGVSIGTASWLAGTGTAVLFIIAALYSIALLSRYPTGPERARNTMSTKGHMVLYGAMVLLFVVVNAINREHSTAELIGGTLEVAVRSLPLAFLFVGTYFESRFEFFDIFVKRGLSLMVTLAVLAATFAVARPLFDYYAGAAVAPWVYAIALLPVAMAMPLLHAWIGRTLDRRWLGRRYTTVGAVTHFLSGLRSATTEDSLVEQAEIALTGIFDAPSAVRLQGREPDRPAGFECVEEVAIVSGEGPAGRFLLGTRRNEAPYFSEDVALLGSLADVFASVLDTLRLQLRQQEQDRRARDLSLHASRSELKALRAQINPHFLFNALNAIAGLIHRDPAVADRTVEKLADVFRYALRGSEAEWTLLDDELEFVEAYLDVEQARFGTRLRVRVDLDDSARGARVPTMVVQTLVENAVKHGAATVRGQAVVEIRARREGDRLLITVEDNGPGFGAAQDDPASAARRRGGYGLANVRGRLEGYFGDAAALLIDRDPARERTVATLTMPFVVHDVRAAPAVAPVLQESACGQRERPEGSEAQPSPRARGARGWGPERTKS